jgi:outer membrane protein assembly factor BamB
LPVRWSPTENIAWRTGIPGSGNSSPVIWGDRIFLTTAFDSGKRRSIVGVRRPDGALLFVKDAPAAPPEPNVRDKNGYASATPVIDGERVIAFLGNCGLVAFDFDGNIAWRRELPSFDATHGTAASPAICGDLVILLQEQSEKPSLAIGVDRRTGDLRWQLDRPAAMGWCTPLPVRIDGRETLVWGSSTAVVGIHPQTGVELWRCSGPTIEVVPTLVHGHGLVYSSSGRSGPTLAIRPVGQGDITATNIAWRVVRNAPHVPSPLLSGEILYTVSDTGILSAFEATTGKTLFQSRLGARFSASPVAGDGKVYLTSEEGDTFVIRDGRTYELLGKSSVGEPVLASPAILGGRIFIRGQSSLFAIGPAADRS